MKVYGLTPKEYKKLKKQYEKAENPQAPPPVKKVF